MIIDELVTLLKFDLKGEAKARAFQQINQQIGEIAKDTTAAIAGIGAGVGIFAKSVSDSVAASYSWAQSNGVAYDSLQKISNIAEVIGGDIETAKDFTSKWARVAQDSGRDVLEILEEQAQAFQGKSASEQKALAQSLNYSDEELKIFQLSAAERKKIIEQTPIVPESSAKAALDFTKTWRGVSNQIVSSLRVSVSAALPAIQSIVKSIGDFINRNKGLITQNVGAFFKSVAISAKILFVTLYPLIKTVEVLLNALNFLTGGLAKYLILIPLITGLFLTWAVALGVKTYTSILSMIAGVNEYIQAGMRLIPVIAQHIRMTVFQTIAERKKLGFDQMAVLMSELKQKSLLRLIGLQIKEFAIMLKSIPARIHNAVLTWRQAVLNNAEAISQGKSNLSQALSLKLIWGKITAFAKMIAVSVVYISKLIAQVVWTGILIVKEIAWAAVLGVVTAAQWALNAAMYANPVGLVIAGIVALIAVIVLLVKYWDNIIAGLKKIWDYCKAFAMAIPNMTKAMVNTIINFAKGLYQKAVNIIKYIKKEWSGVANVAGIILTAFNPVLGLISSIYLHSEKLVNLWKGAKSWLKDVWQGLTGKMPEDLNKPITRDQAIAASKTRKAMLAQKQNVTMRMVATPIWENEMANITSQKATVKAAVSPSITNNSANNHSTVINNNQHINLNSPAAVSQWHREEANMLERSGFQGNMATV